MGMSTDVCGYLIFIIIYIPIISLFFFTLSSFTSDEFIIAFIFVILFKLLSIVIYVIFCGNENWMNTLLISFISDGIAISFQFFWFPKILESGWIGILVISCVINIYITAISAFYFNKGEILPMEEFVLIVDYWFLIVVYVIAVCAAAIAIAIAAGIIYLAFLCLSCICSGDSWN